MNLLPLRKEDKDPHGASELGSSFSLDSKGSQQCPWEQNISQASRSGDHPDPCTGAVPRGSGRGYGINPICQTNRKIRFSFLNFWPYPAAFGSLVPSPWIKLTPPALEVWSLNHWTIREVPKNKIF